MSIDKEQSSPSDAPSTRLLPRRVFAECYSNGRLTNEAALVIKELIARSGSGVIHEVQGPIEILCFTIEELHKLNSITKVDLAIGNPRFIRYALTNVLGIDPNLLTPPDYPECLKHLLHRRMWLSTLGELESLFSDDVDRRIFVKPADESKAFNGESIKKEDVSLLLPIWRETLPSSFTIHCTEVVDMVVEARAYVVKGEVRCICQYTGSAEAGSLIDRSIIRSAAKVLYASEDSLGGCGMDFALLRVTPESTSKGGSGDDLYITALIEVNDGICTGAYKGVSSRDFTDMFLARWSQLMSLRTA